MFAIAGGIILAVVLLAALGVVLRPHPTRQQRAAARARYANFKAALDRMEHRAK